MDKTRKLAQAREEDTQGQLEDLELQMQLLQEDTQIPTREWQNQIALHSTGNFNQRRKYRLFSAGQHFFCSSR